MNCKVIICIAVLFLGMNLFGQDLKKVYVDETSQTKSLNGTDNNEIKVNLLTSVVGLPELNYERFLANNMGVGLAVAVSVDKIASMSLRYMALPYYRLYFGSKKASGFFIEANTALVRQKERTYDLSYDNINNTYYYTNIRIRSTTNFGFGVATGFKFLSKNGFVGEVYLGGGRLFGDPIDDAYPRLGISLGKRF